MIKATVMGTNPLMGACCDGWFIQIAFVSYRTYQLPDAFAKANTPILIRNYDDQIPWAKALVKTIVIDDIRTR